MRRSFLDVLFVSRAVTRLVAAITITSLAGVLVDNLFGPYTAYSIVGLSSYFLQYGLVWQLLSYLFFVPSSADIGFLWLFFFAFTLYTTIYLGEMVGGLFSPRTFLRVFFGSGLVASSATLLTAMLFGVAPVLAGPWPALLSLLWLWTMHRGPVIVFSARGKMIPLHWLTGGMVALSLAVLLIAGRGPAIVGYLAAIVATHIVGVWCWNLDAPFQRLTPLDRFLRKAERWWRNSWLGKKRRAQNKDSIQRGKRVTSRGEGVILSDDLFIEAMLEKVAREGERALTPEERRRLDLLSEKKGR